MAACRFACVAVVAALSSLSAATAERPNIVWIVVEDMSCHFGCYGESTIDTPRVDRLAAEGVRFSRAFVTAPVCSAARSALITGMYQTSIGAHHHRSGRGERKIHLPEGVRLVPELFREAGYYTVNAYYPSRGDIIGKTDYNFEWDASAYDGNDWAGRKPDQPFFAQVQLRGGKLRDADKWYADVEANVENLVAPGQVTLPPYYPDDAVIREDWARYLNAVRHTDAEAGAVIDRLRAEGLLDNTYIFFFTDHGISHARGKQFLYDEGIRVPLIVRGPGITAGRVRDDLIVHIDVAATSLALAGIDVPPYMQGCDLFADGYHPRSFIVAARDRCDETVDRIRCVRTERYKYIRNDHPFRPYLQPNAYKDAKPTLRRLRELAAEGKLSPVESLVMAETRPAEELYDLRDDPFEVVNLAGDPRVAEDLMRLRQTLNTWIRTTGDCGQRPEGAMYDSDMAVYLSRTSKSTEYNEQVHRNVDLMKLWDRRGQ